MSDTSSSGTPDGAQPTAITQSDTQPADQVADTPAGVPDGTVLETATSTGTARERVVVENELDQDGNPVLDADGNPKQTFYKVPVTE